MKYIVPNQKFYKNITLYWPLIKGPRSFRLQAPALPCPTPLPTPVSSLSLSLSFSFYSMSDIPVAWVHRAVVQALLSAGTRCAPQDLFKALGLPLPLPPLPPPPPPLASAVEDEDEDEDEDGDEDGDPNNTYRPRLTAHEAAWVHKALLQPAAEGAEPPHVTARQLVRALESASWAPGDHAWRVDKVLETSLKLMNPTLPTWTQLRAYARTARYHPLHTYYGDRGADGWPVRYGADAAEQDDDNDDSSRPVRASCAQGGLGSEAVLGETLWCKRGRIRTFSSPSASPFLLFTGPRAWIPSP